MEDGFDPAIRIVDHDPAVPGLAAKPILDLQLSVDALEPPERYAEPLTRLGYVFVPTDDPPGYPLYAKPPERPRTHHLHICVAGSEHELRHVAVRDFLRAHPDEAARYEALKRDVAARHPQTGSPTSPARRRTSPRSSGGPSRGRGASRGYANDGLRFLLELAALAALAGASPGTTALSSR